jgi:hypothetical protein
MSFMVRQSRPSTRLLAAIGLVLGALAPPGVQSQAVASVRGKVTGADGVPIAGALLELTGTRDSSRTSPAGQFLFQRVAVGLQVLRVRMLGYRPRLQAILVTADSGWNGTITLETAVVELPEIRVTSALGKPAEFAHTTKYDDYFRRRRLGIGTFRTRADIERKRAFDLVSVLQGIPGVRISSTVNPYGETEVRMHITRCHPPRIAFYIDGHRVALFLGSGLSEGGVRSTCDDCVRIAETFSQVLLRDIEFVEFYRGPGQIPSDLDRDVCAALVVWTR